MNNIADPPSCSSIHSTSHSFHQHHHQLLSILNHTTPHFTPRHATPRHATPHHATPHHTTLYHTTPATSSATSSCSPHHTIPHHASNIIDYSILLGIHVVDHDGLAAFGVSTPPETPTPLEPLPDGRRGRIDVDGGILSRDTRYVRPTPHTHAPRSRVKRIMSRDAK